MRAFKWLRHNWFVFVAFLIGGLPLLFYFGYPLPYEPPKILVFMVAVEIMLAAGIAVRMWNKPLRSILDGILRLRPSRLDWAVIAWLFIFALATVFSIAPFQSFWGSYERGMGLLFMLHLSVLYFLLRTVLTQRRKEQLIKAILIGSGLVSIYAIAQHFLIDFSGLVGAFRLLCHGGPVRAFSTLGHPNFLGAYLAILIPLTLYFISYAASRKMRVFWVGIFAVQSLALLWTFSRGALVAAGIAVVLFAGVWVFEKGTRKVKRTAVMLVFAGFVAGGILVWMGMTGVRTGNLYVDRLASASNLREGSVLIRVSEWQYLTQYIKARPILGYGPETFEYFYVPRKKDIQERLPDCATADPSIPDRAHNQILDTFLASGILGLAAWLAVVLYALTTCFRRRGKDRVLRLALGASLIAYLVQNQFSFDFSISLMLFFVIIALIPNSMIEFKKNSE